MKREFKRHIDRLNGRDGNDGEGGRFAEKQMSGHRKLFAQCLDSFNDSLLSSGASHLNFDDLAFDGIIMMN